MQRFMTCSLLLCFSLGLSADDQRPQMKTTSLQGEKKPNMFPMAKGAQWEFEVNVNGMKLAVVQEMTDVTKKGDQTNATITTKVNGQDITEEISVDEKGIYRHSFNNMKLDKPMLAFKYPAQPQKWNEAVKIQGMDLDVKLEMKAAEEVNVPAGNYKKVIPVEITLTIQGQEIIATNYYAEGAGIIKQEANFAGTKITSELKKYTPGEK
jgi:hypothetical protein